MAASLSAFSVILADRRCSSRPRSAGPGCATRRHSTAVRAHGGIDVFHGAALDLVIWLAVGRVDDGNGAPGAGGYGGIGDVVVPHAAHCAADGVMPLAPFVRAGIVGLKRPNRGLWLASAHWRLRLHADASRRGNRLQPCEAGVKMRHGRRMRVALVASLISAVSKLWHGAFASQASVDHARHCSKAFKRRPPMTPTLRRIGSPLRSF